MEATAFLHSGGFAFASYYSPRLVEAFKHCLDLRWEKKNKVWISEGRDVLLDLERFGVRVVAGEPPAAQAIADYRQRLEAIVQLHHSSFQLDYQQLGTQMLLLQQRGVLADQMGLGKSKTALDAAAQLNAQRILVLAPKSLLWNWEAEVNKWYPSWRPYIVPTTRVKERIAAYDKIQRDDLDRTTPVVVIANWEKVLSPEWPDRLWDAAIFDEAHALRNRRTQRSRQVAYIAHSSSASWALTGTPVVNSAADIYGVLSAVRPGVLGSWWRFASQHIEADQWGAFRAAKNVELLQERVAPWILRRTHLDVAGQLPQEPLRTTIEVELEPAERRAYEKAKRRVLDNATGRWVSHRALAPVQRFLAAPELTGYDVLGSKFEALRQILDGWDGRAVVFCHHVDVAHWLQTKLLSHPEAMIIGEVPARERLGRVERFNAGALGNVFVCNDAGAYGLNITGAGLAVHYELDWLPSVEEQREGRIWRRGQQLRPQIVSIVVRKSLDSYIRLRNDEYRSRRKQLVEEPAGMLAAAELRRALA